MNRTVRRAGPVVALALAAGTSGARMPPDPCLAGILAAAPTRAACTREDDPVLPALARLADYLDAQALEEPHALLFLDTIHRWFGGDRYGGLLARYDRLTAASPTRGPVLRVFRRVLVRDGPLDVADLDAITTDFDPFTGRALHCDRLALGDDYVAMLRDAAVRGGYAVTHVLMALGWLQENGCELNTPAGFETGVAWSVAGLIDAEAPATDLEIEAAALLAWRGLGNLVPPGFIAQVLRLQAGDGGLVSATSPRRDSSVHTSVLAFWLLLQDAVPADAARSMLAGSE